MTQAKQKRLVLPNYCDDLVSICALNLVGVAGSFRCVWAYLSQTMRCLVLFNQRHIYPAIICGKQATGRSTQSCALICSSYIIRQHFVLTSDLFILRMPQTTLSLSSHLQQRKKPCVFSNLPNFITLLDKLSNQFQQSIKLLPRALEIRCGHLSCKRTLLVFLHIIF